MSSSPIASVAQDIVVFGAGGYARCIADAAECDGRYRIVAFVDKDGGRGETQLDLPVVSEADYFSSSDYPACGVVGVGDGSVRETVVQRILAQRPEFRFVTVVHSDATVSRYAQIGPGTVILAGSIVNTGARLGEHVSIYTNAVVEHDNSIAAFVSLAPTTSLGGNVTIGARSFVGMGAVVKHGVEIGPDVIIGAGSIVLENVPGSFVVAGNPARVVRARLPGKPYL